MHINDGAGNMIARDASGSQRWAENHGIFWGASSTYEELPAGLYRCAEAPNIGPILMKQSIDVDSLMVLPDNDSEAVLEEFERFWKLESKFRARGFLMKRGVMLWGAPGSGKTSTINLMVRSLIDHKRGIVIFVDHPGIAAQCLRLVRRIEPKRPMIVIMEDLDALTDKYGEHEFLALLDGEAQIDNVAFVATTNYPERLDARFTDRPSRFDTIREIRMPSASAREAYFVAKEPSLSKAELADWVRASDGLSVAHLKEMIIAVRCFGQSLDEVVKRLSGMRVKPSSEQGGDRRETGFGLSGMVKRQQARIGAR
jgi:predicted AAA+ superfamily ATPase